MITSETLKEIAAALAKVQAEIKPAIKDAENPAFKRGNKASKYADLGAVWNACRGALTKNGVSVIQEVTASKETGVGVTTRLLHQSGEWIECGPLLVPLGKQDAHGVGSATTYAKRYALAAAVGVVADEDDDGNGAANANGHDEIIVINDAEAAELSRLIDEVSADVPKFLDYMKVTELRNIPADQFGRAKHALEQKRKAIDKAA